MRVKSVEKSQEPLGTVSFAGGKGPRDFWCSTLHKSSPFLRIVRLAGTSKSRFVGGSKYQERSLSMKTPKQSKLKAPAAAASPRPLSLMDLEVPVRPLLTREEEIFLGSKVRQSLRRLRTLLPRHPVGYRRLLARMSEVTSGGSLMYTWLSFKDRIEADFGKATRALERAERWVENGDEKKARQAYRRGVKVLETYNLDPETLLQWSREVFESDQKPGAMGQLAEFPRLHRVLGRALEILANDRDRMVLPNLRLVMKEVFRYHPTGMRRSDLFQEGIIGLHKAVFRYDPTRGIRFSTYATYWIRQSIRKALIDKSRVIRVPQAVQEELRKKTCRLAENEADRVRRILTETVLFSAGDSDDSDDRFSFDVKDVSPQAAGSRGLHIGRVPKAVAEALESLSTRERDVLQRRFGLGGERPQTLEEIGTHLNLSRERIRQIEREALEHMKHDNDLVEVYEELDLVDGSGAALARN